MSSQSSSTMHRQFPKRLDALGEIALFVEQFAEAQQLGLEAVMPVQLAIEELVTNMMRHSAGAGDVIDISLAQTDGQVEVVLREPDVEEFNPLHHIPDLDNTSLEDRRAGGMGLFMVQQLAVVHYEYRDGTGITTLELKTGESNV